MDISTVNDELNAAKTRTMGSLHDFGKMRLANTDADGNEISPQISIFIDWSEALLTRIPEDWRIYLEQVPADVQRLIGETSDLCDLVAKQLDVPLGSRGTKLHQLAGKAKNIVNRQVTSLQNLLFLTFIGDDRSKRAEGLSLRLQEIVASAEQALTEATARSEVLGQMVAASQEATAKVAASGRARVFHNLGRSHQDAALRWLAASAVLALILVGIATSFATNTLFPPPIGSGDGVLANYIVGKVLLLGTIGAATGFAAKQYSAHRHNAVQNYHRSSALRTYRALVLASRDEGAHDLILAQAAQAIFNPTDTGYTKPSAGENANYLPLVQALTKAPVDRTSP